VHLLLGVSTDALMPDRQASYVECGLGVIRGGSSDVEHFSLHEPCRDGQ
jgi:hypothetical protein